MKKIISAIIISVFVTIHAFAQNADNKWVIGLGPGVSINMNKNNASDEFINDNRDDNYLVNLYVSRYLNPSFDLMLDNRMSFSGDGPGEITGVDVFNTALNLRYKLNNGYILKENSMVQPFLVGGIAYMRDDKKGGLTYNGGAGLKVALNEKTALYASATYVGGIAGADHLQATSIIEFALGKAKDSDGDGIPEKKDECPDTPPGVQVDEKGCPLDRDGDGVPDYKDDCPDEPGDVSLTGCPDKDSDGVADNKDKCPNIPGLVKFDGCPDSDEDGVSDNEDICADTPKGCPVDASGCPLDSDGDGVIDCEDKCPQEKGSINNNGCVEWVTEEVPTIYFEFDSFKLDEEDKAILDKLAGELTSSKEFEVVVGGHTCDIGDERYNMKLSEKRVQAVVKYLLMKGVNNAYIGSNNYGETKPAVSNSTLSNREQNRRAEFEVVRIRK